MLQKLVYLKTHPVYTLQKEVVSFIQKIQSVKPADIFDPNIHCTVAFAQRVLKKNKSGTNNDLYNHLESFFNKYKQLGAQQKVVLTAFKRMNSVKLLFDYAETLIEKEDLPAQIQTEAHKLFVYLYEETLSSYGIKNHYEAFWKAQSNNWCPFCGMEKLLHFNHQKEDYDHLLPKSKYPFAAVNMRNLCPTCIKCNRVHKKVKDLIWDDTKQIKAVSPYERKLIVKIDFGGTILPSGRNRKGQWKMKFLPDRDEVKRWEKVYNISDRIIKDYLSKGAKSDYHTWMTFYMNFQRNQRGLTTLKKVRDSLIDFGNNYETARYQDGYYIKADLFKWIGENAPDTMIQSIMDVINKKKLKTP